MEEQLQSSNGTETNHISHANDEPRPVGFWARVFASIIDNILLTIFVVAIYVTFFDIDQWLGTSPSDPMMDLIIQIIAPMVAVIMLWVLYSATPGKMLLGAVIVQKDGISKPSTGQLIGRYLGYFISAIPLCLGFIWVAFDSQKRGWHDLVSGTRVVYKRKESDTI